MIFFVFICNRLTWLLHLNLLLWDLWVIQEVIRWRDRRNWSKEWWICPTFGYTYTMEACGNGHIQLKGRLKMLSPVHHPICRWQFGGSVSGIKISLHSSFFFCFRAFANVPLHSLKFGWNPKARQKDTCPNLHSGTVQTFKSPTDNFALASAPVSMANG